MEYLILIIVFVVAVGLTFAVTRRSAARKAQQPAPDERRLTDTTGDHRQLRLGDAVGLDGRMYLVEGSLRFDEEGYRWQEHLLVDGDARLWLSVEEDEGRLLLVRWERETGSTLEPGEEKLSHGGTEYELFERGSASYTAEGSTGTAPAGEVEYVDYVAGERRLGFERYGSGGWELSSGQEVSPHAVDVYPGGGETPR